VKQSIEPGAMSALFPAKAFQTGLPFYIIVFTMTNETHDTDDKTRLISLPEAAELYGFNAVYLRNLARKRRLKAEKVGNTWITTPNDSIPAEVNIDVETVQRLERTPRGKTPLVVHRPPVHDALRRHGVEPLFTR
jgi:hypothetical protein